MLEVVLEICSVCDDAKAVLGDYYSLCIVVRFKPDYVSHGGMSTFFQHEYIITHLSFFSPSCLSTRDTVDAMSGYCGNDE